MDTLAHQQWNHFDKRSSSSPFLFASPDGKAPSTARKVHLRRLRDILHLSIQRGDLLLARRAFGLLARCPEIEWTAIWKIGLVILATDSPPGGDNILGTTKHVEFLRVMMLQHPEEVRSVVLHFKFQGHSIPLPSIQPHLHACLTAPACFSANRSYRNWCYPSRWLDGSAMPSMSLSCADPRISLCPYIHPTQSNVAIFHRRHTRIILFCIHTRVSFAYDWR